MGPQFPDAGYTVKLTRATDSVSATVITESTAGPRQLATLDCSALATVSDPDDLKQWTLEYAIDGGLAPSHRGLRLTQAGDVSVSTGRSGVTEHASPDLMTKITEFLKSAQKATPFTPGPDQRSTSLTLTSAGVIEELELTSNIADLLSQTIDRAIKRAFLGNWWESEWKLCHPAAQLTAGQMDVPIESLIFRDDGHFSVTWRGGGAESPGRPGEPFIWVPDYSGSYTIIPDDDSIHLKFENGIHAQRDFSGDGHFQIDGEKLVLNNLWLGTYQAKQRPDICEMTFKRSSDAASPQQRAHR